MQEVTNTQREFELGDWIRVGERIYGVVKGIEISGAIVTDFADGERMKLKHESLKKGSAAVFLQEIQKYAEKALGASTAEVNDAHYAISTKLNSDLMSFETLNALNDHIKNVVNSRAQEWQGNRYDYDKRGVEIRGQQDQYKRLSYKQLEKEIQAAEAVGNDEIVQFLSWIQKQTATARESGHGGGGCIQMLHDLEDAMATKAIDQGLPYFTEAVVTEFITAAPQAAPRKRTRNKPAVAVVQTEVSNVVPFVNGTVGGQACPAGVAYEDIFGTIEKTAEIIDNDIFAQFGAVEQAEQIEFETGTDLVNFEIVPAADAKCPVCGDPGCYHCWECGEMCWEHKADCQYVNGEPIPKPEGIGDAQSATGEEPAVSTVETAASATEAAPIPVQTDAGKVDPETGEVYEESLIMRKFGWTEMPSLPTDREPTPKELNAFEEKVDQVAEHCAAQKSTVARWTRQNELRCEPLVKASDFWLEQFVLPMSKLLAPHRLPKVHSGKKKGEYSKKTLHLRSGSISFEKSGGYYVHDKKLVIKHIEEKGIENFKMINAEKVITYKYPKLIDALKSGELKDVPGTGSNLEHPLAKATFVIPGVEPAKEKEVNEDDE